MAQARDEAELSIRFGHLLTQLRGMDGRNLSLRAAAKLMGISHTRLRSLEMGRHHETGFPTLPPPELVTRIAQTYRYSRQELMLRAGYLPLLLDDREAKELIAFLQHLEQHLD